jgi:hypothetical protein
MPTEPHTVTDAQHYFLSTVRQIQTALIDTIRTWTTITEQLTHTSGSPSPTWTSPAPWTGPSTSPSRPSPPSTSSR